MADCNYEQLYINMLERLVNEYCASTKCIVALFERYKIMLRDDKSAFGSRICGMLDDYINADFARNAVITQLDSDYASTEELIEVNDYLLDMVEVSITTLNAFMLWIDTHPELSIEKDDCIDLLEEIRRQEAEE